MIYSGSILLRYGWQATALATFLSAFSVLVVAFAWPQLKQPDPARRSTLVLILSMVLAIGLVSTYPLLTANDMGGQFRWIGVATSVTAAIPLALLLWHRSPHGNNTSPELGV